MPARFRIKEYKAGAYYHIYNKGSDGREIFRDTEDYEEFFKLLERYLTEYREDQDPRYKNARPSIVAHKQDMSLQGEVTLIAYCLMPNHYHLLVQQKSQQGITKLLRRVITGYVMYFNKKYHRTGPLFENVYRGVLLTGESQVVEIGKLIHLNPQRREKRRFGLVETTTGITAESYKYSSYSIYIGTKYNNWIQPVYGEISQVGYRKYVESDRSEADQEFKKMMIDE